MLLVAQIFNTALNSFISGGIVAMATFHHFHAYELMLGLHVFRQTGPPRRVDCLAPPSVCHIKTRASR